MENGGVWLAKHTPSRFPFAERSLGGNDYLTYSIPSSCEYDGPAKGVYNESNLG